MDKPATARTASPVRARASEPSIEVQFCIDEDLRRFVPQRVYAPAIIPPGFPVPRLGERVHLASSSVWVVTVVDHRWCAPDRLRIEVWLEPVGRDAREAPGVEDTVARLH
jgi:hypothetical protein